MIAYIKGVVIEKSPTTVVIECNKLAFSINIPLSTFEKLPLPNNEVQLHSYLHFSKDDVKLFGFKTVQEKELFKLLITVTGIGPKIAMAILSTISWQSFVKYIRSEDEKSLTIVPGLGKKTAQRLILELKDKIEKSNLIAYVPSIETTSDRVFNEAESALITLGYRLSDIRLAFEEIDKAEVSDSSELIIKQVIKLIYQRKKGS